MKKGIGKWFFVSAMFFLFGCSLQSWGAVQEVTSVVRTSNIREFVDQLSDMVTEAETSLQNADGFALAASSSEYESMRLIVRANASLPVDQYGASRVLAGTGNYYIMQFPSIQSTIAAQKALQSNAAVVYAELDTLVSVDDAQDESGARVSASSIIDPDDGYDSWGVAYMEADQYSYYASSVAKNSSEVVVAVLDTGADLDHPYLVNKLVPGYDVVGADAVPEDMNSHGTHVAGIIAETTKNANVKIRPIKVLYDNGKAYASEVAAGIYYDLETYQDAVINLSLGGEHASNRCLEEAIAAADAKDVTVVTSSGNDAADIANICPAHITSCITVSSINFNNVISNTSNYGNAVDICAPGVLIYSSITNGEYGYKNGTSMAAAYVSAAAAMIRLANPSYSAKTIQQTLKNCAKDLGSTGWDRFYGYGLPKLSKLIQVKQGWSRADGQYYYYVDNELQKSKWIQWNGSWYYVDEDGIRCIGWMQLQNRYWYYLGDDGRMQTGWQLIHGKTYYLGSTGSGLRATGWKQISGLWYYFDSNGNPLSGLTKLGSCWYNFAADYHMLCGLQTINGQLYYFGAANSGTMRTNYWYHEGDQWYFFGANGVAVTGFSKIGVKNYYFRADGIMQTGWQTIGQNRYYFGEKADGAMTVGWRQIDGEWSYFSSEGYAKKSWLNLNGSWYYFDSRYKMLTGWQTLGGRRYYLGAVNSGVMAKGWKRLDGYYYYFNASGYMQVGWLTIGNVKYYLTPATGRMVTGRQTIDGTVYEFAASGALIGTSSSAVLETQILNVNQTYSADLDKDGSQDEIVYCEGNGVIQIYVDQQLRYTTRQYPAWTLGGESGTVVLRNTATGGMFLEILMTEYAGARAEHTLLGFYGNTMRSWDLQFGGTSSASMEMTGSQSFFVTVKGTFPLIGTVVWKEMYLISSGEVKRLAQPAEITEAIYWENGNAYVRNGWVTSQECSMMTSLDGSGSCMTVAANEAVTLKLLVNEDGIVYGQITDRGNTGYIRISGTEQGSDAYFNGIR